MAQGDLDDLIAAARAAARNAHVPASGFRVGAAVRAADGRVFAGCNVENASYGLTLCAERGAVVHAVAEGATRLDLCVVATPSAEPAPPCGACCQVLAEFGPDMAVILVGAAGSPRRHTLRDFLPHPFTFARD